MRCWRQASAARCDVLVVADAWSQEDVVLLVRLVYGDVNHQAVGYGAVPVRLVDLEEDTVAGATAIDRTTGALARTDA